ncbi:M3 family metallopeptidase [Streptomyces sp. NPDC005811]|uniref:M3 family metallopeptidase n=1 Tax=Streptomyces sp. NPDC005811 TaxID=3154565 RepID=UPI0033F4E47C
MTAATHAVEHSSLDDIDAELAAMMQRLSALLAAPPLTDAGFVELAAIFDNVAYVFLYLESNAVHVDYRRVLPWRDRFFRDRDLDDRLRSALLGLRCTDPDIEQARRAYLDRLVQRGDDTQDNSDAELERLNDKAKALLADAENRHGELARRLRVGRPGRRVWPAYYRLLSQTADAEIRVKLNAAWVRTRDQDLDALADTVNELVRIRQARAAANGYATALDNTLTRCRVDRPAVDSLLDDYLRRAVASHVALDKHVRDTLGADSGGVADHFGRYAALLGRGTIIPLVDLNASLRCLATVARRLLGLELTTVPTTSPHVIVVTVALGGREVGRVNFDLWDSSERPRGANTTRGIRNRTDAAGIVQQPVAYVSCRFNRAGAGAGRVNFQNAHSLFHEFGHAVNHLLIRRRLPSESGLEYLPLERLENLSMWFEKWVYHPVLAEHLNLNSDEARGLAFAQHVKLLEYRRTHLERGVTAALDVLVHGDPGMGVQEAYARLDARYGLAGNCTLGDVLGSFTWPMFQANPGAYFAYLWGAADSAARFAPFRSLTLDKCPNAAVVRAGFKDCFDFDAPSPPPDVAALFDFYDTPVGGTAQ